MRSERMKQMRQWAVTVWMISALVLAACSSAAPSANSGSRSSTESSAPMPQSSDSEPVAQAPGSEGAATANRMLIARANISLVVADTQAAVDAISALMDEMGGYLSDSNLYR